jgi:hypothetical protein
MTDSEIKKLWRSFGKSEQERLLILFRMRGLEPNGPVPAASAVVPDDPLIGGEGGLFQKMFEMSTEASVEEKLRQVTASLSGQRI